MASAALFVNGFSHSTWGWRRKRGPWILCGAPTRPPLPCARAQQIKKPAQDCHVLSRLQRHDTHPRVVSTEPRLAVSEGTHVPRARPCCPMRRGHMRPGARCDKRIGDCKPSKGEPVAKTDKKGSRSGTCLCVCVRVKGGDGEYALGSAIYTASISVSASSAWRSSRSAI